MSAVSPNNAPNGVYVLASIGGYGVLHAAGNTVPADGADGYAPGCLFHQLDGTTGATVVYVNVGSRTAADFDPLSAMTAQSAALTAADGGTVDTTYGQDEADVITNLVVRVGEIEAALEAAGIVAAN